MGLELVQATLVLLFWLGMQMELLIIMQTQKLLTWFTPPSRHTIWVIPMCFIELERMVLLGMLAGIWEQITVIILTTYFLDIIDMYEQT